MIMNCSQLRKSSEGSSLFDWRNAIELVFNLLVLVGAVKASDRIVKEMMGL